MEQTRRLTRCALLTALALGLSYIERFIPLQLLVPLPGIKLGLANTVTLAALVSMGYKNALAILVARCLLGGMFGGGLTGFLFSVIGGLLALAVMALARKIRLFSIYGVSILGAAAHNVGQIGAAMALMRSYYVAGYLPYLLLIAIVTGFATGTVGAGILGTLTKLSTGTGRIPPIYSWRS